MRFLRLLIKVGFIVTAFYAIINLIGIVVAQPLFYDKAVGIFEFVLGIDVYTWLFYGVLSIVTFLAKLYVNSVEVDVGRIVKWLDLQAVLHFAFMIISFGGIYYLFENCF